MNGVPMILGITDSQIVFIVDGRLYQTAFANAISLTADHADQAAALIASGAAIPQDESYLTQFPWLYDENVLMVEEGTGSNYFQTSQSLITENKVDIWA